MEKEIKIVSRKKFFAWTAGISSLFMLPAFLKNFGKKNREVKTVKMLTREGRLVEIDVADIPSKKKKVKMADIHNWINKKPSL